MKGFENEPTRAAPRYRNPNCRLVPFRCAGRDTESTRADPTGQVWLPGGETVNTAVEDARMLEEMKKAEALQQELVRRLEHGSPAGAVARQARSYQQEALRILARRRLLDTLMDYIPHASNPRLHRRAHEFYSQVAAIDRLPARR